MNHHSDTVTDYATEYDLEHAHHGDAWRDMTANDCWERVVIVTHTAEALESALDIGKPILCENPVAWTSERIAEIREAADGNIVVGYNRRHYRSARQAKEVSWRTGRSWRR